MVTLVIGGGGSGKSAFAEGIAQKYSGATAYIATMEPYGEEGAKRIERHRKMRLGKGFDTIEQYSFINEKTAENYENVLLECVSNLVANHIFTENDDNVVENVANGIGEMIKAVKMQLSSQMIYLPMAVIMMILHGIISQSLAR